MSLGSRGLNRLKVLCVCSAWDLVYVGGMCWDSMDTHAGGGHDKYCSSDIYTVICSRRRVDEVQALCVCKYVMCGA